MSSDNSTASGQAAGNSPSGQRSGGNRPGHFTGKEGHVSAHVNPADPKKKLVPKGRAPASSSSSSGEKATASAPKAPWAPPKPEENRKDAEMPDADNEPASGVTVHPSVPTANQWAFFDEERERHEKKLKLGGPEEDEGDELQYKMKDSLPHGIMYQEPAHLYPEYLDIDKKEQFPLSTVHSGSGAYRGVDRPGFTTGKGGKTKIGIAPIPAMIYVRDPEGFGHTFGWASRTFDKEKLGGDPRLTSIAFRTDTQRPSTAITIKMSERQNVIYEIYANSLSRDEEFIGLDFLAGTHSSIVNTLPFNPARGKTISVVDDAMKVDGEKKKLHKQLKDEEKYVVLVKGSPDHREWTRRHALEDLANKHELWQTDISLIPAGSEPTSGATGRPCWAGISHDEIAAIERKKEEDRSEAENLIVRLNQATILSVYQGLWKDSVADHTLFFQHMRSTSYACAHLGNFWWYDLAFPKGSTRSVDYPFATVPIPRWLVTKWRVKYVNTMPVSAEPAACVSFRYVESGVFPDAATFAFENRLGTAREAHHVAQALDRMSDSSMVTVFGIFWMNVENHYIAHLRFSRNDSSIARFVVPEVGTKVELGISVGGRDLRLDGKIIHDPFPSSHADFAAFVSTSQLNVPQVTDDTLEHIVTVTYPNDPTAINRCLNAIRILQEGQDRKEGAYIPEFTLGAPRPSDARAGYLSRLFAQRPAKSNAFSNEIARHRLNGSQIDAVRSITMHNVDLACIMGPPGTGKTKAMAALIMGLLAAGCTLLVCAASNTAVDKLATEMHELGRLPAGLDELSWVRYTSALARTKPGDTDEDIRMATDSSTDNADSYVGSWSDDVEKAEKDHDALLFTQIMLDARATASTLAESFGYARKKLAFVNKCAGPVITDPADGQHLVEDIFSSEAESHSSHKGRAIEFLDTLNQLGEARKLNRKGSRPLRAKFYELDEYFSEHYIKERVKLVLCTPSMASKEPLIDHFKPNVFCMDEAGQSSPPDTMTPLAAYKENIMAVVFAGDYKQLNPVVVSKNTGESHEVLSRSLFANLVNDPHHRFPMVMLNTQYRMDPTLSKFPREHIYANIGELRDAESVKNLSETQRQIKGLLQPLRDSHVWNGRVRMAINCEGPSVVPQGATSPENESEANQAVAIAVGLVRHNIDPKRILIISPYLGQRRKIKDVLFGQSYEPATRVGLASTHKVQGEEADVVILSLVQHDEEDANKIGFIYEEDQICVEITRAKGWLFVLGNIKRWMQVIKANRREGDLLMTSDYRLFRDFIKDCHEMNDVINASDWHAVMVEKQHLERSTYYSSVFANPPAPRKGGQKKPSKDTKATEFSHRVEAPAQDLEQMSLGDGDGDDKGKGKGKGKAPSGRPSDGSSRGKPHSHGGRGKPPGTGKNSRGGRA